MIKALVITSIFTLFGAIQASAVTSEYLFSDDRDTQTLFTSEVTHGGYGGLLYGFTIINDELTYLRGTRGAWIINLSSDHALNLGYGSYRTRSDFETAEWRFDDVPEPELRTNYSGFEMEYVNRSYRLVHFSAQALIGSGNVRYDDRNLDDFPGINRTRDSYFVMQPGVNMSLNITSWFKITGGVAYRYATSVNLEGTSNSDLSGLSGFIGLRFGSFR